jgi:hypothetical protein
MAQWKQQKQRQRQHKVAQKEALALQGGAGSHSGKAGGGLLPGRNDGGDDLAEFVHMGKGSAGREHLVRATSAEKVRDMRAAMLLLTAAAPQPLPTQTPIRK